MPTALFLSPHLDDVAFSCGGTLAKLAAAGWHCVLATAFTKSVPNPTGFALTCQTDKGLSPGLDYLAVRRAEDAEFGRIVGAAEVLWLDFPEAPHRGYASAAELFAGLKIQDEVSDPLTERLMAPGSVCWLMALVLSIQSRHSIISKSPERAETRTNPS